MRIRYGLKIKELGGLGLLRNLAPPPIGNGVTHDAIQVTHDAIDVTHVSGPIPLNPSLYVGNH